MRLGFLLFVIGCVSASAADWYVSQSGAGSVNGSSCDNAQTAAWFNTSANWGSSIVAGDTVHLCGTITSTLTVGGSGTALQPIKINLENASVSTAASTCVSLDNKSYIILDGGTNGVIENTDNGSELGNQVQSHLISASGAGGFECRNLIIRNGYTHTLYTDNATNSGTQSGIYLNGYTNGLSIHNCVFSNVLWAVNASTPGSPDTFIISNKFLNYDHGVAVIGGSTLTNANVVVSWNDFGDTAIWDTPLDAHHHDGIHMFYGTTAFLCGLTIHDNIFHGDWGTNNTAFIFLEGNQSTANNRLTNLWIYNNYADGSRLSHILNNPMFTVSCCGSNANILNNTVVGNPAFTFQVALGVANADNHVVNNIFDNVSTFIRSTSASDAITSLSNNIYAGLVTSGNHAFYFQNTGYDTATAFDAAAGGHNDSLLSSVALNSDGTLPSGSAAIGAGLNLSAVFTNDLAHVTRASSGAWDVGAYAFNQQAGGQNPQSGVSFLIGAGVTIGSGQFQ